MGLLLKKKERNIAEKGKWWERMAFLEMNSTCMWIKRESPSFNLSVGASRSKFHHLELKIKKGIETNKNKKKYRRRAPESYEFRVEVQQRNKELIWIQGTSPLKQRGKKKRQRAVFEGEWTLFSLLCINHSSFFKEFYCLLNSAFLMLLVLVKFWFLDNSKLYCFLC